MPRPTRALALLLVLGLFVLAAPARAHEDPAPESITPAIHASIQTRDAGRTDAGSVAAGPPRATGLAWLSILAELAAGLAFARPRRALAAAPEPTRAVAIARPLPANHERAPPLPAS